MSGNQGHGHVRLRPDGVKARCGGPAICSTCQAEQAARDPAIAGNVMKIRGTEGPLMTVQQTVDGVASLVWFWNGRVQRADLPADLLEPVG